MPRAGPDVELCGAQRTDQPPGVTCRQRAGWGTPHPGIGWCKRHSGSTPSGVRSAQHQIARQAVTRLMLIDPDEIGEIDARDVLAEELWRSRAAVAVLGALVNNLAPVSGGLYGPLRHPDGSPTGRALPHVLWVMLSDERRHLRAVASDAAKAGVEARRIELAEATAQLVADVIRAVLADPALKLDADAQQAGALAAARHLRALPASN